MQSGELGGRHPSATAVRANLVVVLPPDGDRCSGLRQCFEPVVVHPRGVDGQHRRAVERVAREHVLNRRIPQIAG